MPSGRLAVRAVLAAAALALAAAAPAHAGDRPSGKSLWKAYPLDPAATSSPPATLPRFKPGKAHVEIPVKTTTDFGTSEPEIEQVGHASPPAKPSGGGGIPLLPLGLAGLGAAGLAAFLIARRRRRRRPPEEPRLVRVGPPPPTRPTQTTERLRAAVDYRLAREWPWPVDTEGLWRCEIAPDAAALSARFAAVVFPPDGPPREVAAARATHWQAADPPAEAVERLAAALRSDGWEPVEAGGGVRRFCWRHDEPPPALTEEEAGWTARHS